MLEWEFGLGEAEAPARQEGRDREGLRRLSSTASAFGLTRGANVDLKTGKPSPTGTHLAVYVEPTGVRTRPMTSPAASWR